jgi:hypothetical protein
VTVFALLVFFLQGLAVQTHIHAPFQTLAAKATSLPEPAPLKAQDPIDQCRLCQEVAHAGIFVAPPASAAAILLTFALAVFAALPGFAPRSATAFAWQSRAPPRR